MGSLMVSVIMKILLSLVLLYSCVQAQRSPLAKKFKDEGVVKDVLSEAPKNQLSVDYVEEEVSVDLGNTLTVVDPDAPSRDDPKAAQWLHWLVVNIPGDKLKNGEGIDFGKTLMQHNGPSPPKGSGPHRYVFVVYEQPRNINARVSRNRAGFKVETFAKRNRIGSPVDGNFFYAENK